MVVGEIQVRTVGLLHFGMVSIVVSYLILIFVKIVTMPFLGLLKS